MSFREKSAWVMALLMAGTGLVYAWLVARISSAMGETAPPLAAAVPYVLAVVVGAIVLQTGLALLSPREASAPADERERGIIDRAGHWSGVVLAAGLAVALAHFLIVGDGRMLFHLALGAMIVGQVAEHVLEIALFRRRSF
ncbi:MAG: hypothetical protein ACK4RV_05870 [Caulobacter sp.]